MASASIIGPSSSLIHFDSREADQHKTEAEKQHMRLICIAVNDFRQRRKRSPTASTD
jgi:hypothetical protein